MFGSSGPSLADIAAVTGNRNNGDGLGDGNGWWVLIILFAIFGGWGGNYGYGGGSNAALTNADLQRGFDTQSILGSLRGIEQGLCSLGYDQLGQFNNISTQIMQSGFQTTQAIQQDTIANMQNTNALSRQLSDCCCDLRSGLKDVIFEMSQNNCATNTNIHQTGDAIIQNQNQGFQMLNNTIRDGFCNLEMREMQRENQALRDRLNNCDRDSALQGTASYIINSVRPTPIPSWNVQNPWAGCNCNSGCCNQNSCCCA